MLLMYNLLEGSEMLTYHDIQAKYGEVLTAQRELRQQFKQVAMALFTAFNDSLNLEHKHWTVPGSDETQEYVYPCLLHDGKVRKARFEEIILESTDALKFLIAVTIDKSPVAFPKYTSTVPLTIVRDGEGFVVTVGDGVYQTSVSKHCVAGEFDEISEVMKKLIIAELDRHIPA